MTDIPTPKVVAVGQYIVIMTELNWLDKKILSGSVCLSAFQPVISSGLELAESSSLALVENYKIQIS